jgi:hypothetical protein
VTRARLPSAAVAAAGSVALALLAWEVPGFLPQPGFDHSWQIALHLAAVDHLDFGRDVVFTYGPLGFLSQPLLVSEWTGVASSLYAFAAQVALALVVLVAAARVYGRLLGAVVAFAALGLTLLVSDIPVYLAFFAAVWALERAEPPQEAWLVPVCGAVAAFELLVKLNGGVVCLLLAALFVWRLPPGRVRSELVLAAAFVGTLVVLWLASGNPVGLLPVWIERSRQLISSYTNAVALAPAGRGGEAIWAAVLLAGGLALLSTRARRLPRGRFAALALVAAVYAFAYVKEGFVRADFHSLYFFAAFGVSVLAFAWSGVERWLALALVAAAAAAIVATPDVTLRSLYRPIRQAGIGLREMRDVVDPPAERRDAQVARDDARAQLALSPQELRLLRGHDVDVVPYETSAIWAYGFDWRPEPLLQWYTAFNGRLDRFNASRLAGRGAQRILRQRAPVVDAKVAEFEAPASYLALLCHYRELAADGSWQVLARTSNRCGRPHVVGTAIAHDGQSVPVPPAPEPDDLVYARIRFGRAPARQLESFVLRPFSVPTIQLGGTFRFLPETAGGPLVLRMPASAGMSPLFAGTASYDWFALDHVPAPFAVEFVAQRIRPSRTPRPIASVPSGSLTGTTVRIGSRRYRVSGRPFDGWVDVAVPSSETAVFAGWAVEPARRRPAPLVAVFSGRRLVAEARPSESRQDVALGLHTPAYATAGWSATLPRPGANAHVRVFALGHGSAAELHYPAGYRWP